MLYKLLKNSKNDGIQPVVVSLTSLGFYGEKIRGLGVPVYALSMRKFHFPVKKYAEIIRKHDINVVQSWMYHANFFSVVCKPFVSHSIKYVWNIRTSFKYKSNKKTLTRLLIKLSAKLSKYVDGIVNNSKESQRQHHGIGYFKRNDIYIPNGFDTKIFKPNRFIYIDFRNKHRLKVDAKIIMNVSRFHPVKNHKGFLVVASLMKKWDSTIQFVLAGEGCDKGNEELVTLIKKHDLSRHVTMLGIVESKNILPAADLYLSCSHEEGFPNIIGEAMCCGVPCVSTDVSDCKLIINNFGEVAKVGSYKELSESCLRVLNGMYSTEDMIEHMKKNYSIHDICSQYNNIYLSSVI